MASIELVIFDLDGTLVDSIPDLTDAVNEFLCASGRPALAMDDVRRLVGKGARNLVERALGNGTEEEVEKSLAIFLAYNEAHIADKTIMYPGVAETLHELRRQGLRMAVVTNKTEFLSRKLLSVIGIDRYFDLILGADSLPFRKPSPEPVLKVLADLHIAPSGAIMVGDSINDIAAGRAAGVVTVGCTFGYGSEAELAQAEYRIDAMGQLLQLPMLGK